MVFISSKMYDAAVYSGGDFNGAYTDHPVAIVVAELYADVRSGKSSARDLRLMETRAQTPQNSVIPAKAGIHFNQEPLDSRLRGNDGLKDLVRNQDMEYRAT